MAARVFTWIPGARPLNRPSPAPRTDMTMHTPARTGSMPVLSGVTSFNR